VIQLDHEVNMDADATLDELPLAPRAPPPEVLAPPLPDFPWPAEAADE